MFEKTKINVKEAGNGQFKKMNKNTSDFICIIYAKMSSLDQALEYLLKNVKMYLMLLATTVNNNNSDNIVDLTEA